MTSLNPPDAHNGPEIAPALSPYYQSHSSENEEGDSFRNEPVSAVRNVAERLNANGGEIAEKVSRSFNRAALSVQERTRQTVERAQRNARTTATTAREHPVMTAAVIGGIATAVYAGTRLFQARRNGDEQPLVAGKSDVTTPKRAAPAKRKH